MITKPMRKVRCRWFCCVAATLILILALVPNLTAKSPEISLQGNPERVAVEYKDTLLSVEAQKATLLTVFLAIADKTQYEFLVPEELLQREVTLSCSKTDLDKAVKRVLDASGVRNYALVFGVREADTGGKSVHQIEVVLLSSAPESAARIIMTRDEGASLMPEGQQRAVGEVPTPEPVSTDLPQPESVSTVLPQPEPLTKDLPQPGPVTKDLPQPGPLTKDLPQPGPVTKDLPQPGPLTKDLPQPGPVTNELP